MKISNIVLGITLGTLFSIQVVAIPAVASPNTTEAGIRVLDRGDKLSKVGTLQLCIDYYELTSEDDRKPYIKELDLRSQLSEKDHNLVPKYIVENSMTICGMYMSRGKPLSEQSRQIRPMTFKTVHVYPDMYFVSQSGIIVKSLKREEGVMPPALVPTLPSIQKPPVAPR